MSDPTRKVVLSHAETGPELSAELEADVENAIAACGGDARATARALLVANNYLAAEAERLTARWEATVSRGYVRLSAREEATD